MISAWLSGDVNKPVQDGGRVAYRLGRVRILKGSASEVHAIVRDSREYSVILAVSDVLNLELSCTCSLAENGICKHMWATVLAADARGYLTKIQGKALRPHRRRDAPLPRWESRLDEIAREQKIRSSSALLWPDRRQLIFTISEVQTEQSLSVLLSTRDRKANGNGWNMAKDLRITRDVIRFLPDSDDQAIMTLLAGSAGDHYGWGFGDYEPIPSHRELGQPLAGFVVPLMCHTGRCFFRSENSHESLPVEWDEGGPWLLHPALEPAGENWKLDATLRGADNREIPLRAPFAITSGLILRYTEEKDKVLAAALDPATSLEWVHALRSKGPILARQKDGSALLERLLTRAELPAIRVPEELRYEDRKVPPRPRLHITSASGSTQLQAALNFTYDGHSVAGEATEPSAFFDQQNRVLSRRDMAAEAQARLLLGELGARWEAPSYINPGGSWRIPAKKLPPLVRTLLKEEWQVEAEGKLFRAAGSTRVEVSSGMDWFELRGEVDYDGTPVSLPALLAAVRRGEHVVQLGDGTFGMLPEQWLGRLGLLAELGDPSRDHIRFERRQAGLLDALLASQEVRVDEGFAHARAQLRRFDGIREAEQPTAFAGVLREYQREGLAWMHFLRQFGFGGCLADDMGVGKTAQVLALLEHRRGQRNGSIPVLAGEDKPTAPSLAVVPRSLVFNWKQEAARFTPHLRILDHTGSDRSIDRFSNYDLIVTTYGTLRRDVPAMRDFEFDYAILDEAQAIKNAGTDAAKAARLLRTRYRLVMTGTPVENHLNDLWSLFEFLNPGMLGSGAGFGLLTSLGRNTGEEARAALSQALRPLILRRTKQQVARELPDKTEQTIFCEMKPQQQKLYNELRDYYRASLMKRIDEEGLAKSKMHVFEALLRLRQVACHPGLVDENRLSEASAKIDLLLDRLKEIADEGHKVLVFSQFTSLLSIVRTQLEKQNVAFAYLDGQTRDRQTVVERFQTDKNCPVFLISLKAGGVGLNLTAAEYVFLLDPWWNPAVEAQAIDRTHRIGQTRQVFAYRLITRGTVEEKVLELQEAKRELAAAIITEDNRVLSNMRREDLEQLLS